MATVPHSTSSVPETTQPTIQTAGRARANARFLVLDIFWFGLALPSTARFLPVYAIRLDASAALLGWLTALPAIIALISSAFSGWWRTKVPDPTRASVIPGFGYRLIFALPALTPLFPPDWQVGWLLVTAALPAVAQGLSAVSFLVLLRVALVQEQITGVVSRRALAFNVSVALGTVAFGFWLERVAFPTNYALMYVAAFALSLVSLGYVNRTRMLDNVTLPPPVHTLEPAWKMPAFRRVILVTVITHSAFFAVVPIIPLRLVDELGASEGYLSLFALAELGSAAALAAGTNGLVQRFGSQVVIAGGMIGTGLSAVLLAASPSLVVALGAGALSGAAWTAAAISVFGYFTEQTPPTNLMRFTRIFNQVVMLSIFVGPLAGSQLANTALPLTTVLLIGAVVRLIAGLWVVTDDMQWSWRLRWRGAR